MVNLEYLIENINTLKDKDINLIRESIFKYPYFQIGYTLLAKLSNPISVEAVQKAAIYATDRDYLQTHLRKTSSLDGVISDKEGYRDRSTNKEVKIDKSCKFVDESYVALPIRTKEKSVDRGDDLDIKSITSKKTKFQHDSIANFLNTRTKFHPKPIDNDNVALVEDLAKDSVTLSCNIATERLAQILMSQGKVESAIDIYKKVILNNPHRKNDLNYIIKKIKLTKKCIK